MSAAAHASPKGRKTFILDRLGSLLAVLPLGVWTVNHLWDNLAAYEGAEAWQRAVTEFDHPTAHWATVVVVLLPLAAHTVWGIQRLLTARPNYPRYSHLANLRYVVQRLSALGLLAFLGAHLWLAMIEPRLVRGQPEAFASLAREMHFHGPTLVVYVLGVLAVAYHLANGLATWAMGWGVAATRRSLRAIEGGSYVLFAVFLAMGWGAIYALWAAGRALGAGPHL